MTAAQYQARKLAEEAFEVGFIKKLSKAARAQYIWMLERNGAHKRALVAAMIVQQLDEWGE